MRHAAPPDRAGAQPTVSAGRSPVSPASVDAALLPPLLQEFEALIGLDATMALVRVYGGLRLYIPTEQRVHPDHPIAQLIGEPALRRLAAHYGGLPHFALPKAERALIATRNARIAAAYAADKTVRQLAIEHCLTERQVERIIAASGVQAPAQRRQTSLF